jgi:hypothetical protein
VGPWLWSPGPPTGPEMRRSKTRAAAAKPRVARPTFARRPPPPPWAGGRRSPLAMGRGRAKQPRASGRQSLLPRVGTRGLRSKLLLLERGFDRGRVIPDLRPGAWPCLRPAGKGGPKPPTAEGPTGTSARAAPQQGHGTPETLSGA